MKGVDTNPGRVYNKPWRPARVAAEGGSMEHDDGLDQWMAEVEHETNIDYDRGHYTPAPIGGDCADCGWGLTETPDHEIFALTPGFHGFRATGIRNPVRPNDRPAPRRTGIESVATSPAKR